MKVVTCRINGINSADPDPLELMCGDVLEKFPFDHLSHVYFRLYLSSLPSLVDLLLFLSHWRPGYNSECVRYMFPTVVGIVPDTMYCDCWQAKLAEMIGPYRQRHSRILTFLDPEDVDVNFVPNDAWDEFMF